MITYLDHDTQLTAQDLATVEHCDRWVDKLNLQIYNLRSFRLPNKRQKSALYYRQRALREVSKRRAHLQRLANP